MRAFSERRSRIAHCQQPAASWRICGRAAALAAVDEDRGPRSEAVAPGVLCSCVAERPVLALLRSSVATNMKNKVLHVIFDLDDGRWPGGR